MAKESLKQPNGGDSEYDEDEDDELLFDPNVALPDNLTFLDPGSLPGSKSSSGVGSKAGMKSDWGTGISQRPFRVGSPTFFSNPNINIPGLVEDEDR